MNEHSEIKDDEDLRDDEEDLRDKLVESFEEMCLEIGKDMQDIFSALPEIIEKTLPTELQNTINKMREETFKVLGVHETELEARYNKIDIDIDFKVFKDFFTALKNYVDFIFDEIIKIIDKKLTATETEQEILEKEGEFKETFEKLQDNFINKIEQTETSPEQPTNI